MDLQKIKKICDDRRIEIKKLAHLTGMSEQNLHRCIRLNKIQASDLENIANALNVSVCEFFDKLVHAEAGDGGVAIAAINNNGNVSLGDVAVLNERIEMLNKLLDEKERLIKVLMERNS